ncbi:hypothetical protein Btru_028069 [Bulinus truncatus]|nr:hypothetical protein Btru_028069 [Bulinus truncatus]
MDMISKERLREMKEEMERFEMEIQGPGGPNAPSQGFILGANTYDRVQAQLSSLRQESSRLQQHRAIPESDSYGDEDFRNHDEDFHQGQQRKYHDEEDDEFHDIDERPGRPQGPLVQPPPPPPSAQANRHPPIQGPPLLGDMSLVNMFAPPPPPPPEPEEAEESTLSFKPYGPGEGPSIPRPAFMPPQLRHRLPPPGSRPPFPRPPLRMGGPGPFMGPPRPMMGPGPMGPQGRPMGMPGSMAPPRPPGMESGVMPFMGPAMETVSKPTVMEPPKVVYSAAPVITVNIKKEDKKKRKKRDKSGSEITEDGDKKPGNLSQAVKEFGSAASITTITPSAEEDKSITDMEIVPESALIGGIMASTPAPAASVAAAATGTPVPGKKEKKKKDKKFIRLAASTIWEDPTLAEWQQDDFRMFCGDLGNEVTDETLVRAFNKYPSFLKAKVIRDRRTNKTKGYGFVSFKDPVDFTRAMREMNVECVYNRPVGAAWVKCSGAPATHLCTSRCHPPILKTRNIGFEDHNRSAQYTNVQGAIGNEFICTPCWPVCCGYTRCMERSEVLLGKERSEVLLGKERSEVLLGNERSEVLLGKERSEVLLGKERSEVLLGKERSEVLLGKERSEVLLGKERSEILLGMERNELL